MLEQTAPSANMLMIQNWEVWLIYHSCAVIQRDLDKSEKQVDVSSINENGQFQTWGAIMYQHRFGDDWLERRKKPGRHKANSILGFTMKSVWRR